MHICISYYIANTCVYAKPVCTLMKHMELWIGLSLICSKIYLLFLPELLKIFTHYSFYIPITPPIIPIVSMIISQCRSDYIYNLHSRLCLLTALIDYLTVLLEYLDLLQTGWQDTVKIWEAWALPGVPFGYTIV